MSVSAEVEYAAAVWALAQLRFAAAVAAAGGRTDLTAVGLANLLWAQAAVRLDARACGHARVCAAWSAREAPHSP